MTQAGECLPTEWHATEFLQDWRRGLLQEVASYEEVIRGKRRIVAAIERELSKRASSGIVTADRPVHAGQP
jgi:hypothetical protein